MVARFDVCLTVSPKHVSVENCRTLSREEQRVYGLHRACGVAKQPLQQLPVSSICRRSWYALGNRVQARDSVTSCEVQAMATGLRYNPLEGDHERGHAGKAARGRRLSITALDDEPEGVALPAVVPLHPQPQPQLQQGSLLHQIRTPVRAAAGHSLPVVSPRSGASSAASSRRSSTNAGAGRSPVSFRDSESRGASSSGRSSRRTQRQRTASDDSTPAAAAAMRRAREGSFGDDMEVAALVPRQLLVLSVSSSEYVSGRPPCQHRTLVSLTCACVPATTQCGWGGTLEVALGHCAARGVPAVPFQATCHCRGQRPQQEACDVDAAGGH